MFSNVAYQAIKKDSAIQKPNDTQRYGHALDPSRGGADRVALLTYFRVMSSVLRIECVKAAYEAYERKGRGSGGRLSITHHYKRVKQFTC
jgi:hypothetical protein